MRQGCLLPVLGAILIPVFVDVLVVQLFVL